VPLDDTLRDAAERSGVQQEFWDIFGRRHVTSPETNRAILTALGFDCASEDTLAASLGDREKNQWRRLLPPVLVVSESAPIAIPVRAPAALAGLDLEIVTEAGQKHRVWLDLLELPAAKSIPVDGELHAEKMADIALKLPLGYHDARAGDCAMRLIVTPDAAYLPQTGASDSGKSAGLGVALYGLRSARNWGCGDFRDLKDLIDWAVPALHASFIALNPLHAIYNRKPFNLSPYLPNSIFYRNFLYLDIESVPGYDRVRARFEDKKTLAEIARLRAAPFVEYEQVAALKRRALDLIFDANPPGADCRDWIAQEGDLLRLFATCCALDEHLHAANPKLWVWPDWPEEYRDPESPAVKRFARDHEREILFHGWLQWQIDQQIAAVQQHALEAGMSIGLYHDLALATDRCGSDLWAHRAFFINGCRVGSPPDDFSPTGQDWSFPPPDSRHHRENGYRLYAESIRHTLRHGGALRIDHVMRLFRLYWIPEGHDATRGAYVRERAEDLVRILALESVRNRALVVGEDLGTVEPEVRKTLARFGILSYRLLYFERDQENFKRPGEYPVQALASSTTHDLPTIAGFWTGDDIEARLEAATIDRAAYESQKAGRARDKQHLLDALFAADLLPKDYPRAADGIPELTGELHHAIAGYLASTPCLLWLTNQEDMTKEPAQQNLPGTTVEYPNWSRKMRWSIEDLSALPEARDSAAMLRNWADRTGRAPGPH
jgi:4-alpha-glucanotransferase